MPFSGLSCSEQKTSTAEIYFVQSQSLVRCDVDHKPRILECHPLPECCSGIKDLGVQVAVTIEMSGEGFGLLRT